MKLNFRSPFASFEPHNNGSLVLFFGFYVSIIFFSQCMNSQNQENREDNPFDYSKTTLSLGKGEIFMFSGENDTIHQLLRIVIECDSAIKQNIIRENESEMAFFDVQKKNDKIVRYQLVQTYKATGKVISSSGTASCEYSSDVYGLTSEGMQSEVLICHYKEERRNFYIEVDNVGDQLIEARVYALENGVLDPDYPELRMKRKVLKKQD